MSPESHPLLENIDGRQWIVDTYSDAHKHLVERAFSTDDIELEFALIVMRYAIVFSICSLHASATSGLHAHITVHEGG